MAQTLEIKRDMRLIPKVVTQMLPVGEMYAHKILGIGITALRQLTTDGIIKTDDRFKSRKYNLEYLLSEAPTTVELNDIYHERYKKKTLLPGALTKHEVEKKANVEKLQEAVKNDKLYKVYSLRQFIPYLPEEEQDNAKFIVECAIDKLRD